MSKLKPHIVEGNFTLLFPLEKSTDTSGYRIFEARGIADAIKTALEEIHMKVKDVKVTAIFPDHPTVAEMIEKEREEMNDAG